MKVPDALAKRSSSRNLVFPGRGDDGGSDAGALQIGLQSAQSLWEGVRVVPGEGLGAQISTGFRLPYPLAPGRETGLARPASLGGCRSQRFLGRPRSCGSRGLVNVVVNVDGGAFGGRTRRMGGTGAGAATVGRRRRGSGGAFAFAFALVGQRRKVVGWNRSEPGQKVAIVHSRPSGMRSCGFCGKRRIDCVE